MATHDYIISNASGAAVRSDLNNALAAIVSNNSSATEPATTYAYMWWADTTSGQLKLRNAANDDWVVLLELDGTTLMEDGTVSAPGLAFADDTNTGFYRPAADSLGIATNGAERVRIDSSGRLLTGTTSSLAMAGTESLLQVASSGAGASLSLRRDVNSADGPILIFGKSRSGSIGGSTVVASGDTYGLISFCGADGTDVNTAGAWIRSKADGTPGADDMPGRLEFYTTADGASTPTERMRIDSSGNVGIGTTSPESPLHVAGSAITLEATTDPGTLTVKTLEAGGAIQFRQSSGTSDRYLALGKVDNADTFYEACRIDDNLRFGIGTTSPAAALHVSASVAELRLTDSDGAGAYSQFISGATGNLFIGADPGNTGSNSFTSFLIDNSEKMRIDSSGRLLVGTSSSRNVVGVEWNQQTEGTSYTGASFVTNANSAIGSYVVLGKSRGTSVGSNTIVQNGDTIGVVSFAAADGTDITTEAANIATYVDGTPGANDMPGRLVFSTTADGASSPTSRLVIKESGDIVMPSTSASAGFWVGTGDSAGNSASSNYRIGQNSVGVGSATLYIGNAAIQVSSDARLKENIQDTALSAVEELQKVRIVDFTWSDPSDTSYNNRNARGTWTGVIAQELIDIFPFAVNAPRREDDLSVDHDSDSVWTVEQQQLVPVLIKAIQEQQVMIETLEAKVAALESA